MEKKKLISISLIILLIANLIMPTISNAVEPAKLEIANSAGADKEILVGDGETFTLNVNFSNPIQNATSLGGSVLYDSSKLKLTNVTAGSDGISTVNGKGTIGDLNYVVTDAAHPGEILFVFSNLTEGTILNSGLAMPLTFEVLDGATGSTEIYFKGVEYIDTQGTAGNSYPITTSEGVEVNFKTPLKSISLNKTATSIEVGGNETLVVSYNPAETTDSKAITWSSDNEDVATVDQNGKVTAVAVGKANITATSAVSGVAAAKCKVTVTAGLQSISIDKTLEMAKGQTKTLNVTYTPSYTTDSKEITWSSSNPSVADVDQNGNVTAYSNGTAKITATSVVSGVAAVECTVNVTAKLQSIAITPNELTMNEGEEEALTVEYTPSDTTDNKDVVWTSSDDTIASVDSTGKVTAKKPGTVTIVADCNGKKATATVEVKSPLKSIEIGEDHQLQPLQEEVLTVIYNPDHTTDSKAVVWESSAPEIVSVTTEGKIKALKPGTATITAKCGSITDSIVITVPEIHIESIAIDNQQKTINVDEKRQLNVIIYPENTTDNTDVVWESSNPEVATISATGEVTALKIGTTTIKATVQQGTEHEMSAELTLEVKAPLKGISIISSLEVVKGNTATITVTYNPDETTDSKEVTWASSNPSVADVDENGNVTANGIGTAIIKATVGKFTESCTVTVIAPLEGISIKENTELLKGQSETLVVTYLPEDTTDDKTVIWSSDDETVATVDENGKVTGLKEGTATITAKVGKFEEKCTVTVKEVALEGIAIDNKVDSILKGENVQLGVIYTPENTTDDKTVVWSSDDETVAIVDETGKVTGLKAGTATITVSNGTLEDSFEIEVKEIPLTGMEIDIDKTTLSKDETLQLEIKFIPGNTTDNPTLTYVSSDETIIMIDENGLITAVGPGTAIVTVIADSGVKTQVELQVLTEQEDHGDENAGDNGNTGNNDQNNNENNNNENTGNVDEVKDEENSSKYPNTGDINVVFYVGLMVVSLIGIVVVAIRRNK